jgi:uncharacterized membrane protein
MMKNHTSQEKWFLRPEQILLFLGIIIGLLYCVFIPFGAGFDEETGLVRVFDISGMHFVPNKSPYAPSEFYTLSYQRRNYQSPAFDLFNTENFSKKIDWNNMASGRTITTYFPANYILQAFVAGIGFRVFNGSVILVTIFMRLVGFAFYLFACYLTIRLLPVGKWLFLIMAFLPMALFQAATITADGFTIASSFLFIGEVLHIYFRDEKKITTKDSSTIAILAILIGCSKAITVILLLLLFLLIKHKFDSKAGKWIILGGVLFSLLISVGWMFGVNFNQKVLSGDSTLTTQIKLVLKDLPGFLKMYFVGFFESIPNYYKNWVGSYGYWVGKVPSVVFILYPLAIIAALFCEKKFFSQLWEGRIFLFIVGVIGIFGVTLYDFVGFYVPGKQIIDIVGRYFIPFAPLLFLTLCGSFEVKINTRRLFHIGILVLMLGFIGLYSYGIYRTYYTKCVYPISSDHTCLLPVYKNLDINNPPAAVLKSESEIRQSIVPECNEIKAVQFMAGNIKSTKNDLGKLVITDDQNKQIAIQQFSINSVNNGRFLKIPVDLENILNKKIWLNLSLEQTDSATSNVNFFERTNGSIYPQGELFVNGIKQDADLVFQYACVNP